MNFARTNRYKRSAIPYIQKLLNEKFKNNPAPGEARFGAARARAGVNLTAILNADDLCNQQKEQEQKRSRRGAEAGEDSVEGL